MNNNVKAFFDAYDSDPALQEKVREAEASYPGSLEIREAVAEDVLIPIAREIGLDFTVAELRAYETKLRFNRSVYDDAEGADEQAAYWLLDHGWNSDEAKFCGDDKKE